jgi:sulfide:quinone oxidoreductase
VKSLVVLGAGTAGTAFANRLVRSIPRDWSVTVVDPEPRHLYQPGLLFVPFGGDDALERERGRTLLPGVAWIRSAVERVEPGGRRVVLGNGDVLAYDLLVLATGARLCPEETPGLDGPAWGETIHEFYTLPGARALRGALEHFRGGRFVVNAVEMPIKCPVAPLELLFLADDFFARRGMRERVELVYATPLDGAFTKPVCSRRLGFLLEEKGISVETEFSASEVFADARMLRSFDGREIPYDLLVTVPVHKGAGFVDASGLGNEMGFVPTDRHTLASKSDDRVFALGDATDLPVSKAGSVAHFEAEVAAENVLRAMAGKSPLPGFDGHANCFIESGRGKALLIDFNYETEPLPGEFPLPGVGPFSLLKESRRNHWGKLAFRPLYWNAILPGRRLPVSNRMSMAGKRPPVAPKEGLHADA